MDGFVFLLFNASGFGIAHEGDCLSVLNPLSNDLLFDEIERLLPSHGERVFPPTETLAMFVTQALIADRSCQHIINQAAIQFVVTGLRSARHASNSQRK